MTIDGGLRFKKALRVSKRVVVILFRVRQSPSKRDTNCYGAAFARLGNAVVTGFTG
jgi:hypothetical protein